MSMKMRKLLFATTIAVLTTASGAHARTYTYMCRVGHNSYPVTVTTPNETSGGLGGGTITWRGVTYPNVKSGDDCKAQFTATRNGVTIELCTATQGVADLRVGKDEFACQM